MIEYKYDPFIEKNCDKDKIENSTIHNLYKKLKDNFPSHCIKINSIQNLVYEDSNKEEESLIRNLQFYKNNQIEFLKSYDIFNIQHEMLRKYLSVKYKFWDSNMKGKNVKVALLDSGVDNRVIKCNLIKEINFTNEENEDYTGHGTYLASVNLYILYRSFVKKT